MGKGLEALEKLYPKTTYMPYYTRSEKRAFCKIIEKELKALEIIKEKVIVVPYLILYLKLDDLKSYNKVIKEKEHKLTKEEFDLLKEVLL